VAEQKSVRVLVGELWELVLAYLKQETVEPIKALGRFVAFGVGGSILLSVGLIMLSLAGLRALQTETGSALTGNFSWVPYLVTMVGALAIAVLATWRISANRAKGRP
jgi:hypothetical protein